MVDAAHHGQEGEFGGGLGGAGAGGCGEKELNIMNLFCGIKSDRILLLFRLRHASSEVAVNVVQGVCDERADVGHGL